MGGGIAVTIREENGTEHRMSAHTNYLPILIDNIRLVHKEDEHLRAYFTEVEREPMTQPLLAPYEYGLVVVDLVENAILSQQGYWEPGIIYGIAVKNWSSGTHYGPRQDGVRLYEFYDEGRIKQVYDSINPRREVALPGTWEETRQLAKSNPFLDFKLDLSPFRVIRYAPDDPLATVEMKREIQRQGFTLSEAEEARWRRYINEDR